MSFISRLFHKEEPKTGGMEDYMTLVRVYFQSAIASQVGITNLAMLPDLRAFKSTFHVATVNNKLGLGEKAYCKKMMQSIYQTTSSTRSIRASAKTAARCRTCRCSCTSFRASARS